MKFFINVCLAVLFICSCPSWADSHNSSDYTTKRVILVHGLARGELSLWWLKRRLEKVGFQVLTLNYKSLNKTVAEVQAQVQQQMEACCRDKVATHYVGYSLGGLLLRVFFADANNQEFVDTRQRVVMIGTPNRGTKVVDKFADKKWFQLLGETTLSLGTDEQSLPMQLPLPDFRGGIIAGGNDGLVLMESTKLANMADFISVDVSHTMLRYSDEVAEQTIHFLRHGHFDHNDRLN